MDASALNTFLQNKLQGSPSVSNREIRSWLQDFCRTAIYQEYPAANPAVIEALLLFQGIAIEEALAAFGIDWESPVTENGKADIIELVSGVMGKALRLTVRQLHQ